MAGEYYDEDAAQRRRPKSGAVTAVAIVNFVLGGLALLCGLLGMLLTTALKSKLPDANETENLGRLHALKFSFQRSCQ